MATRSSITILREETNRTIYKGVYCHSDGYPSHNGEILLECYNTIEKVEELISHGDLSTLGEKLNPQQGVEHSFGNRQSGVCVFYHRDRGEDWEYTKPFERESEAAYYKSNCQEYNYLFMNGKWYWNSWGDDWRDGKPLWRELTKEDCRA